LKQFNLIYTQQGFNLMARPRFRTWPRSPARDIQNINLS